MEVMQSKKKNNKIAVFGGSFNPVHKGHIELAAKAKQEFNLPKVLLMPTAKTYYKNEKDLLAADIRLHMLDLAIKDYNDKHSIKDTYLLSSSLDIDRGGNTHTVDTINDLKKDYDDIYFIIGSDSLMYIDTWVDADVFLKECTIVVAKRNTDNEDDIINKIIYLKEEFGANIIILHSKEYHYSSTVIREYIKEGKDVSGMLSKSVMEFINVNALYR